jgi:hypothetical protein
LVEVLCGPESANSEEIFAQVPAKFKTFFLSKQVDIIKKKHLSWDSRVSCYFSPPEEATHFPLVLTVTKIRRFVLYTEKSQ